MYARLRTFRESLGLTQEEFGKSVGIAKSTYNNYETGIRDPKSDFWISVAEKYDVTIDYLMGYGDNPHRADDKNKDSPPPDEGEEKLIGMYRELNHEGQARLLETADDMVCSGKYKKAGSFGLGKTELA